MINLKTENELELLRVAGKITSETLKMLELNIKPGVTTKQLDKLAYDFIKKNNATPSFKNFNGFPGSICISINDEIVHGIPASNRVLNDGDIVSVDVGACYKGYHGDAARTFAVGKINSLKKKLITVTQKSFFEGIKNIKAGCFVGDISNAVQQYVEKNGFSIVRELVGHGIGKKLHEEPQVPNYGTKGSGPKLNANAVIAIEPMVNAGTKNVKFLSNGWTCVTADGKPSAHYENTVVITEKGVEILTI